VKGLGTRIVIYIVAFSKHFRQRLNVAAQPFILTIKLGGSEYNCLRQEWFSNVRRRHFGGYCCSAGAYSRRSFPSSQVLILGGAASLRMAVSYAIVGGRPGLISAATGAMALLIVHLVKDHGLQYLFATIPDGNFTKFSLVS